MVGYGALEIKMLPCASRRLHGGMMIRCHLSTLMGRDKLKIADVARLSGLNRSTITALYRETATRIELEAINALCTLFKCRVGELFEFVPDANEVRA